MATLPTGANADTFPSAAEMRRPEHDAGLVAAAEARLTPSLEASGAILDDLVRVGVLITTPDASGAMKDVYAKF